MRRRTPARTPALVLGATAMILWLAASLALGATGDAAFDVAALGGPSYAEDFGTVQPVSLDLLAELLGLRPPAGDDGAGSDRRGDDARRTPSPDPSPTDPVETDEPRLVVTMDADRDEAPPGGEIEYTVVVRNVGTRRTGSLAVETHVPEGTELVASADCEGERLSVNPGGGPGSDDSVVCVDVDEVRPPGSPLQRHEITWTHAEGLGAGEQVTYTLRVRVRNDAEPGQEIYNHAHASATNAARASSRDSVVLVVMAG